MTIKKLLIANRGEVAVRIARAAADLDIATVAIYPADDERALHTRVADQAVALSGQGVAAYLDGEQLVRVAREQGCDAVHPGYGFLSESRDFAARCADAGLIFVGPDADTLALLGDKARARVLAEECQVPVVPGTGADTTLDQARAFRDGLGDGATVIVKAIAGGGGRGMRVVESRDQLLNAITLTRSEAKNAFGDATVYMEKFLQRPRHVEIQVLSDGAGHAIHLGDRDCSLQRRHQKVVEEAPAPDIPLHLKNEVAKRCVDACKEINYRGAGTFEFLYEDERFYFIEMNTRVQVEHPVSEMITGVDIVKEQLRIAGDNALRLKQEDVTFLGHAIEVRINAEDPVTFVPSPGRISYFHAPGGNGVRVDSHVYGGYTVPPYYDSLIGKLITWGENREVAFARMRNALDEIVVEGIKTNVALHRDKIFRDPAFQKGGVDIHHLEKKLGN